MSGWEAKHLQAAIDTCRNLSGLLSDCPLFTYHDHETQNKCKIPVPADIASENTANPGTVLPGNVPIEWGPNPAIPGHIPSPQDPTTQARPSATYQPGKEHTSGDIFLPGQIFYATSTAWETASPVQPTQTVVVQAANPTPEPAPPTITEKPSVNNLRVETQTGLDGRVTEIVYQEEIVWVTAEVQVTTTVAAAPVLKPRRSHRYRHQGGRAKSRPNA